MTKYFLVGTSLDNFEISRGIGFNMECFQDRYANRIKKEIKYNECFFVTHIWDICKFGGISKATGIYKCDPTVRYKAPPNNPNETYPHCFEANPILVPANDKLLDTEELVPYLSFVTAKQREIKRWKLAFQNTIMEIRDQQDFERIKSEMKKSGLYREVKQGA